MVPTKAYALALSAWASTSLASAIPRPPFADAPRQRVTAGYGCLMTQDSNEGLTQYHVDIGMARSRKGCQSAFTNLAAATIFDEWNCRPDSAGLTWIEFTASAGSDVGNIVGAIDLSFPGMRWIQTHECRSGAALEPSYLEGHGVTFGGMLSAYLPSAHGGSTKEDTVVSDFTGSASDPSQNVTEQYQSIGVQSKKPLLASIQEALGYVHKWTVTTWEKVSSVVFTMEFDRMVPHSLLTSSTSGPGTYDDNIQVLDEMGGMTEQILAREVETGDHANHQPRSVSMDTGSKPIPTERQGVHAPAAVQGQIRPIEPTTDKQKKPKKPSSCHCTDSTVADGTTQTTCKLQIGKAASRNVKCTNVEQRLREKGWVLQHCKPSTWHGMLLTAKRPKTNNQPTTIIQDVQSVFPAWKVGFQCTHISGSPDLPPSDKTQDTRYQRPDLLHPPAAPPATEERPPLKPNKRGNVVTPNPQTKPVKPTTCKIKEDQNHADVTLLIDEPYVKERCVTAFANFRPTTMNVDGFKCEADKADPKKTKVHYLAPYSKLAEIDETLGRVFEDSLFTCAKESRKGQVKFAEEKGPAVKVGIPMAQKGGFRANALPAGDSEGTIDARTDGLLLEDPPSLPTILRRGEDGDDNNNSQDDNHNNDNKDDGHNNDSQEKPSDDNPEDDSPDNSTFPSLPPGMESEKLCTFKTLYAYKTATTFLNLTVPIEIAQSKQVCDNVMNTLESSGWELSDWNCEAAEDRRSTRVEIAKDGWVAENDMEGLGAVFRDFGFECTADGEGEGEGEEGA